MLCVLCEPLVFFVFKRHSTGIKFDSTYIMEETRRQKQIAGLLQNEMSQILQRNGVSYYGTSFVTITTVKITPDLLVARFYLSVFNANDKTLVLKGLKQHISEIRRELGNRLRNNLRMIPTLEFFLDETLEEAFRIDKILKADPPKDVKTNPDDYNDKYEE